MAFRSCFVRGTGWYFLQDWSIFLLRCLERRFTWDEAVESVIVVVESEDDFASFSDSSGVSNFRPSMRDFAS